MQDVTIKLIQTIPMALDDDIHGTLHPNIGFRFEVKGNEHFNQMLGYLKGITAWQSNDGWEIMDEGKGSTVEFSTIIEDVRMDEALYDYLVSNINLLLSKFGLAVVNNTFDHLIQAWGQHRTNGISPVTVEVTLSKDCYNCGAELEEWYEVSEALSDPITGYVSTEALCEECKKIEEEKAQKRCET